MRRSSNLKDCLQKNPWNATNLLLAVYGGIALQQLAAGNLALFDGNPKTNQCHLNASQTALIYQKQQRGIPLSSEEEKLLILCFFTNFGLRTQEDREHFIDHFLPQEELNRATYIGLFKNNTLKDRCAPSELGTMLFTAVNNMGTVTLNPTACTLTPRDPAPTYPKFLGAQLFLDQVKSGQIPILLRVLINYHQVYFKLFVHGQEPDNQSPVIIVEAHARGEASAITDLLDSCLHAEDFILPCAAFFTHTRQQHLVETFLTGSEDFERNLAIFNKIFVPLDIDIEHVHTECFQQAIGLL